MKRNDEGFILGLKRCIVPGGLRLEINKKSGHEFLFRGKRRWLLRGTRFQVHRVKIGEPGNECHDGGGTM